MIYKKLPLKLQEMQLKVEKVAKDYGLDFYPTVFEFCSPENMHYLAAYGGFPKRYPHWRFGMEYNKIKTTHEYGLAKIYEMVINHNPCFAYLLSTNSMLDHKLVMAHVYGHCDFFKNNIYFGATNRQMLNKMANHGVRIRRYMDKYGQDKVEAVIDKALMLENLIDPGLAFKSADDVNSSDKAQGVYKVPNEKGYMENYVNPPEFLEKQKEAKEMERLNEGLIFPKSPERDVLRFLIDHSNQPDWVKDILAIIREEAYYYYPQMITKIMNEGWASYWHAKMMTEKLCLSSEILDFAETHASVMGDGRSLNPYRLGIELFRDIEDRWNKGKFGPDYDNCKSLKEKESWDKKTNLGRAKIFQVRRVYNDVSFLDNFFTEEFSRKHGYYSYDQAEGDSIKNNNFQAVKEGLLSQLNNGGSPVISIIESNFGNRGGLFLYHGSNSQALDYGKAKDTIKAIGMFWGREVVLLTKEGKRDILLVNENMNISRVESVKQINEIKAMYDL